MIPNSPETEQLLAQARKQDPSALDQLLNSHREPLRRMIGLRLDPLLARRLDASDVVQDVLVEVSRRLPEYLAAPTMPFQLWIRLIARDHIRDAHRRHRRAQRRSLDREQPGPPAWADASSGEWVQNFIDRELTPASAAIRGEMQRRLASALENLNDDDREVILARVYEQLTNQELAAELGLSEAAASMRYLRAVRRLRDLLVADSTSSTGR